MAAIQAVVIEFDPPRIKQGEAGDLTITVKTLDGLVVDLTTFSNLTLALTEYPQHTTLLELVCDTSGDDAEDGICVVVIEGDTFDELFGNLQAELTMESREDRLAYETKSSDFNVGATVTGDESGATAEIVDDVESSDTEGYLVIEDASDTFEAEEAIEDDGDVPGVAVVVAPAVDTLVTRIKSRTAYFYVDRAINPVPAP
jgi:hypothetical protein